MAPGPLVERGRVHGRKIAAMAQAGFVPDLTIVLPAYNERSRIGPALDELFGYLLKSNQEPDTNGLGSWNVLVVDDGSVDGTAAFVESRSEAAADDGEAPRLRVLRTVHGGKGAAVRAGMLAAEGARVIFTDADLATPPDQLPRLRAALDLSDVALGSRVQADGTDGRATQALYRRLLGRLFHAAAAAWVTGPVPDTQCGFKGFTREAAQDLCARQRTTGVVFDAEIIFLARRRGYRIAIVPVQWSDKRGSRMRVGLRPAARVGWDLFRIPVLHFRSVKRREVVVPL